MLCRATAACAGRRRSTTAESLLRGAPRQRGAGGLASTLDDVRAGEATRSADRRRAAVRLDCCAWRRCSDARRCRRIARLHAVVGRGVRSPTTLAGPVRRVRRPAARSGRAAAPAPTPPRSWSPRSCTPTLAAGRARSPPTTGSSRAHAERLVLVARGVDAKSLVVPEAGHLVQRGVRVEPARATRRRAAGRARVALYGAEAFAAGAEASPSAPS